LLWRKSGHSVVLVISCAKRADDRRRPRPIERASLTGELIMSEWLHNLPILWMTVVVFGLTYLMTTAIQGLVTALAQGGRARAFKAISTGMLSPLAITGDIAA